MSDDTPTERFPQPGPAGAAGAQPPDAAPTGAPGPGNDRSKTLIVVLSVIGGLLLIAVVVLLTLLFSRGLGGDPEVSAGPSASESPSASPSVSPSAEPETSPSPSPSEEAPPPPPPPPPPTTGPVFNSFSPADNSSVGCTGDSGAVTVTFTWASTGADEAAIGVATTDAFAGPYQTGLPPSGSFNLDYQCGNETQLYTVSIRGASGQTNKTITLKR